MHAAQQRIWLLEQIRSLAQHADLEPTERGTYAIGVTKGGVDAYIRAARAFGLSTDAEIKELIPGRFLEGHSSGRPAPAAPVERGEPGERAPDLRFFL